MKKRIISLFLSLVMVFSLLPVPALADETVDPNDPAEASVTGRQWNFAPNYINDTAYSYYFNSSYNNEVEGYPGVEGYSPTNAVIIRSSLPADIQNLIKSVEAEAPTSYEKVQELAQAAVADGTIAQELYERFCPDAAEDGSVVFHASTAGDNYDIRFYYDVNTSAWVAQVKTCQDAAHKTEPNADKSYLALRNIWSGNGQRYLLFRGLVTRVEFADGVSFSGSTAAFAGFYNLKSVDFANWPGTSIANNAFMSTCLAQDGVLDLSKLPTTVTSIGGYAFGRYNNVGNAVNTVILPQDMTTVTIASNAFSNNAATIKGYLTDTAAIAKLRGIGFTYIDMNTWAEETNGDITWTYSDGTLTVTGTGAIPNYTVGALAPWAGKAITNVVIGEGITAIGDYAFYGQAGLTGTVTLPKTVTSVGEYAFALAEKENAPLQLLYLKDTTIARTAKANRPDSLADKEVLAAGNYGTVATPGVYDSETKKLTQEPVLSGNVTYMIYQDGSDIVMELSGTGATAGFTYGAGSLIDAGHTNPQPVEIRGEDGLGRQVTKLIINEGITSVGYCAFDYFTALKEVVLPESLTTIGANAFHRAFAPGAKLYGMKNGISTYDKTWGEAGYTIQIPASVTSIANYFASYNSVGAEFGKIYFANPNTKINVTNRNQLFSNPDSITIAVSNQGNDCAVRTWASDKNIKFKDLTDDNAVEKVEDKDNGITYEVSGGVLYVNAIDPLKGTVANVTAGLLSGANEAKIPHITKIVIGGGVKTIAANAFSDYTGVTAVSLPNTLTSIGSKAFGTTSANSNLTSVTIGKAATVAEDAFAGRTIATANVGTDAQKTALDGEATTINVDNTYSVLLIGNSYSEDASNCSPMTASRLQQMLQKAYPNKDVIVGLCYSGGKTMAWHYDKAMKGTSDYSLKISSGDGKWTSIGTMSSAAALGYRDWDVVSLQPYATETRTGTGSNYHTETTKYSYTLEESLGYMLHYVKCYAPAAKEYLYMTWNETTNTVLNAGVDGYNQIVEQLVTKAYSYVGKYKNADGTFTETGEKFAGVIPVGTAVQNERNTYLALVQHNVEAIANTNVNLTTDPVKGLQRDGGHLSYNVGRYTAALTFAKALTGADTDALMKGITSAYSGTALTALPADYLDIIKTSVDNAVATPNAVTDRGANDDVDPADRAKALAEAEVYSYAVTSKSACTTDGAAAYLKSAVENAIAALTDNGYSEIKVKSVKVNTLTDPAANADGTLEAEVTISYGYTTVTASVAGVTTLVKEVDLPAGLKLIGGTAGSTDYSSANAPVDGTSGNPSVVTEYIAENNVTSATKTEVTGKAGELSLPAGTEVLDVVEVNLYINNSGTLTRVSNAELNANIEVLIPYSKAVPGQTYVLYHYNGTGFDDSIAAEGVMVGGVKYLKFQYNKFSPFVIVGGVGYNAITATTGEGYTVTYSGMGKTGEDYTFTVTVDSGYTLQSVKANGNAFTATDPTYVKVSDTTYTIKNLNDNYKIEVKVTKNATQANLTYADTVGNGAVAAAATNVGSVVTVKTTVPVAVGKTFLGWRSSHEGTVYQPGDTFIMPATDVTLTAQWQDNDVKVTVSYESNGATTGTAPAAKEYVVGTTIDITSAVFTKTGNTFVGWSDGTNTYPSGGKYVVPGTNVTLTAQWTADPTEYTVTYDVNGAAEQTPAAQKGVSGAVITLDAGTYTKDGYAFAGWNTASDGSGATYAAGSNYTITGNVTLYAKFVSTTKNATITYNLNGGSGGPTGGTATVGSIATIPDTVPTRDGYTFQGWKSSYTGTILQPGDSFNVLGNTTFTAQWVANTYTVTFKANGSGVYDLPAALTVVKGSKIDAPAAPGREGYTFDGWYKEAACTNEWNFTSDTVTANTNLYAKWTKNTTYSVTYHKNVTNVAVTGMPDSISDIASGSKYTISNAEPSRAGYTFKGWATTAGGTVEYQPGASITVTGNVDLYAVWQQNTVKVTLPNSGTGYTIASSDLTVGGDKNVTEGSAQTFTVTVTAGYDPATMKVTANGKELSATAVSDNEYTYKFVADVDTVIDVVAPSKLTYTITLPTGEHFTAKFTAPTEAGGKGSYTFNYGATDAVFSVQLKDGYTGTVYIDGVAKPEIGKDGNATYALHSSDGGIKHVCDIRVETTKVQTFTVTYTIDGQTYTTRTVDEGTAVKSLASIAVPAKTGYTFGAWYSNPGLTTALSSTADTVKVTADMEVYGKWTPVSGTIKYNLNSTEATGTFNDQTKIYGQALKLHTGSPTRTGFTFKGWATTADGAAVYQPGDMYATEIGEETVTLYAVWEQITFTVTLPSGTGYSISTTQSTTVNYGANFTFTVKVDRGYASTIPTVKANTVDYTPSALTTPATDGSRSYPITISNITADQAVSVSVTENETYTVTFYTWKNDGTTTTEVYLTQQVEDTYKATQPANPVIEGYTFKGWYTVKSGFDFALGTGTADKALDATYNFNDAVTGNLVVVAKMDPIKPEVTIPANVASNGWTIDFTDSTGSLSGRTHTHAYNADCTFKVTVANGYDASNMQVGANGVALAPTKIDGNVYTYVVSGVKVNTNITVVGVVRKTVKITYSANADDDVSKMPGVQTVNSYVESASDNGKIVNIIPSRVGYTFQGWATTPTGTVKYAKADIVGTPGATSRETSDTTLYAIWEANTTSITLAVSDVAVDAAAPANAKEYEGQKVTLTATIAAAPSTGSVIFYQSSDNGANWTVINSQSANSSTKYTFEATTGAYAGTDTYKVEYKAESAEGYGSSNSNEVIVDRLSTAITWKLNGSNEVDGTGDYHYASTIAISGLTAGTPMTAGQTYTLTAPAVYELGTDYTTALKVGTDYTITWQYLDGANGWKTLAEKQTTSTYQVTSEYSKYQFRALMVVNTGNSTVYTKAAKFANDYSGPRDTTATMGWLISEPTPAVVVQTTTTKLAITGADNEAADVVINNGTPFNAGTTPIDAHDAQYEGEKVTLTATVKETSTGTPAVRFGSVEFYQNGTLIATVPVGTAGANMGVASFEAIMTAFDGTKSVTANKDVFTAKYVANATYDESTTSTASDVYIKSTAIQTPVINSALPGKRGSVTGATSTSYTEDLTELQAGVKHTFTLKTTGANTTDTADWSVVALDGRTVTAKNYDIQWLVTTGTNEEQAPNEAKLAEFIVENSKSGDKYRVKLTPKGHMKTGAISNYVVIGTKQDVSVTVTTSDEIASTPVKDAYQLDEVTLTATVAAKETTASMKPSGTVEFYYELSGKAYYLGDAILAQAPDGSMKASIVTTKLPVTADTNVKQDVKVTAIYHGDSSFFESGTYVDSSKAITVTTNPDLTNAKADITIYSSVVYVNNTVENKAVTCSGHANGIYISVIDGKLNANETNVTLQLSDVYTLDHDDALSKLAIGTDYTVQWQKLSNAAAYSDYAANTAPWANITGETNVTCALVVDQGAAYRAVITVGPETDINRGSYTKIDQDIDGRQVYYSNVLVAGSGDLDLTVTTNTSKTEDGFEGIVEGEIVTINTFASGATNTTPISELTVTVTKQGETAPVFKQVKTDVNGYTSFDWTTTAPGYYTLTVTAVPSNGYAAKTVTRTLIVRDDKYDFEIVNSITSKVYNGKAQGLTVSVNNMGIENELAQKSVVVYYYSDAARTKMVEPSDAGTYYATIRLQESAYWTEKTEDVTFTITKRPVSVVDLVAQAKVYDGTTAANLQEIVLNDATVNAAGVPTVDTGVLNGDSIYAIGTGKTSSAAAGTVTLTVTGAALKGDDAENYELVDATYGEAFVIQRNQLKGDIADATYAYTGSSITVPADDIAVIDQQGNDFTDYTVTYYYHNGDGVEKVSAMKALGLYTVVVTPRDTKNYKGGAAQKVYVAAAANDVDPVPSYSATISITNTVELFGHTTGVEATATKGTATVQYYVNGAWTGRPTDAGRYLVKATVTNGTVTDTAYGLYTIVKADPALSLTASDANYDSALQNGSPVLTGEPSSAEVYYTWTGGTIQGVSYTAPTEVGKYVVTAHVNETANYTAHEVSATYEIKPVTLTIKADSYQRHQYGEYPQMTATFSGLATGGSVIYAPDTSLRDVQIQPEFLFSGNNDALDQAGNYTVTPVSALARNYTVEYVNGLFTVTQVDGNPELAICGMISNGDGDKTIAYYGDEIQLYAYGSQKNKVINNSSIWTWSVTGPATIDSATGLLKITGVGTVTVTLTRGIGAQKISTSITITALKQEIKIIVPDEDMVYSAASQSYTKGNISAVNGKLETITDPVTSKVVFTNDSRTNVGSQIVNAVVSGANKYQSETYGGRFTVNDKDVTVTPDAQSVVYGTDLSIVETAFTVTGEFSSVKALTDTNVASVRELYNNLDVANQYEILVTGTENINYNVKYVTAPTAPQVTVDDKALTVKTGVYANKIGQTSGSLNPAGEYPNDNRLAFTAGDLSSCFAQTTTRMYGEPNQVMGYVLETLIAGDSEADLTALLDWLVKYDFNIAGHASVTYQNHNTPITASQYPGYSIPAANQQIVTGATMMNLVNYTEAYALGTQNIYQRPVKLKCNISDANKELPKSTTPDKLKNILIQNITADKLDNGEGGLATLLKHTVANLDLKVNYSLYDADTNTWTSPSASFTGLAGYEKVKATIYVGNPDYYAVPLNIEFDVTPVKYVIKIVSFGQTSAVVDLYEYNEENGTQQRTWFPADETQPVGSTSSAMTCKIYNLVAGANKYVDYAYETPVVNQKMVKTSMEGRYTLNYSALYGDFRMFAIADGYIIIDNT